MAGVIKFNFKQNIEESVRINEMFGGGRMLFPRDDLADFAEYVRALDCFPEHVARDAVLLFENHRDVKLEEKEQEALLEYNVKAGEKPVEPAAWSWRFDAEEFEAEISELNQKIVVSRVRYL